MAYDLTATTLIETARLRGWLPSATDSVSDADVLAVMTSELRLGMGALLRSVNEDYGLETVNVTVTSGEGWLPRAAAGLALTRVQYVSGSQKFRLDPIAAKAEPDWSWTTTWPTVYYIAGSKVFVPGAWSGTISVSYQAMAPKLVASSSGAQVSTVTSTINTASTPSGWGTTGLSLDIISGRPGCQVLAREVSATRSSNAYTVAAAALALTSAGDWLATYGESPVVPLPFELLEVLALRTARNIAIASGLPNAASLAQLAQEATQDALRFMKPRAPGAQVIVRRPPLRSRGSGGLR